MAKIDFKYNWSIYWSMLKEHKLSFLSILVIILIIEGSHIADQFIFKLFIDYSTEYANQLLPQNEFVQAVIVLGIVFGSLALMRSILKWVQIHYLNRLETNLIRKLKSTFFTHILNLSHNFHTTHKTGSLISRLVRGGNAMERMTDTIVFNFAPLIFKLTIALIAISFYSIPAAIVLFSTMAVYIVYTYLMQRAQEPASIKRNDTEDYEKAMIADYLTNVDSIKYFGKEDEITARFDGHVNESRAAMLKHWDYFKWMDAGQTLILGSGLITLVAVCLRQFLAGTITLGSLVFVYTAFLGMIGPLYSFLHGIRTYYITMADFQAIFQYGKFENEIKNKETAKNCVVEKGEIEYKNVTFSYGRRKIFKNLNLKIPKGKKIALVGHSGSGKTTLIKLLYRLYDVNSGSIRVDGKDIRDFKKESYRNQLTIVPQEAVLFDDTIWNNVKFSKLNATDNEVRSAIKFAQLDKIIEQMPDKDKTIVGERGVRLSGGEKQRVSIARALLADRKILVLDEATSALDSQTENEIQRDLQQLMQGRTSVIIAHRLSTIMHADEIIVLDKGEIVQRGTHKQLMRRKGHYKHLWELQKGGFIE